MYRAVALWALRAGIDLDDSTGWSNWREGRAYRVLTATRFF